MPKVIFGRKRIQTSGVPYERTTEKESDNKRSRFTSESTKGLSTSKLKSQIVRQSTITVPSTSTTGKVSHIRQLEALARATTKLRVDYENAATSGKECLPWVERNLPQNLDELFVHSKKVGDVRAWMEKAFDYSISLQAKMCLLTGPSGSGKTATAFLVAKELDAEVKEWINPMNLTQFKEGQFSENKGDEVLGRSQLDLFTDFLLRSSQYPSLPMKGMKIFKNRIIIVEDFPNSFYRDTRDFHSILRNYAVNGTSPIIFIVPDSPFGDFNPSKLFPKPLLSDLNITHFSFNPVAITFMNKFLATVCSRENIPVEQSIIKGVAEASSGDIRCAINTLQFKILQEKPATKGGFKRPLNNRLTKDKMFKNQDLTQKDESLFLFRAIGKVLYNKRDRTEEAEIEFELHEQLKEHRRPFATQDVPEDIADKIEVSTETFLGFLHQNYLNFFGSIETCSKAAKFLADSEVLLSRWNYEDNCGLKSFKNQDTREKLALSVGIRGLMHSNDSRVSSQFRPLRKPLCGDIRIKVGAIKENARSLISTPDSILESYYYETIPFYAKNLGQYLNQDQQQFARDVGLMKDFKHAKPRLLETLDEKGVIELEDTDPIRTNDLQNNSFELKCVGAQPEVVDGTPEDFRIEEFDDDE